MNYRQTDLFAAAGYESLRATVNKGDERERARLALRASATLNHSDFRVHGPDGRAVESRISGQPPVLRPRIQGPHEYPEVRSGAPLHVCIEQVVVRKKKTVSITGITERGHVVQFETVFNPSLWVLLPDDLQSPGIRRVVDKLNELLSAGGEDEAVVSHGVEHCKRLVGYSNRPRRCLRLTMRSGWDVGSQQENDRARENGRKPRNAFVHLCEKGLELSKGTPPRRFEVFNHDVSLQQQFLNVHGLVQYRWAWFSGVEVLVLKRPPTTAQLHATFETVAGDPDCLTPARRVRAVFDGEMVAAAGPGHFPDARNPDDLLTTLGTLLVVDDERWHVLHVLGDCEAPDHWTGHDGRSPETPIVCRFGSERALLNHWHRMVFVDCDVDALVGYNSISFDLPYLVARARRAGCEGFTCMGRVLGEEQRLRSKDSSSAQRGSDKLAYYDIPDRLQFDVLRFVLGMQRKHRSYRLGDVAKAMTKDSAKMDLDYKLILPHFVGGRDDPTLRGEVARYCLQDVVVTHELAAQNAMYESLEQTAALNNTHPMDLMVKGQQVRLWNLINQRCGDRRGGRLRFIVNRADTERFNAMLAGKYKGATVKEPMPGMHKRIITLDFESLYPSIMIANNLCWSMLITDDEAREAALEDGRAILAVQLVTGDVVEFAQVYAQGEDKGRGLAPEILEHLLAARKVDKAQMKAAAKAGDLRMKEVHDQKQQAKKVTANSLYGFMGADAGYLPCKVIAASVTTLGRSMLDTVTAIVQGPRLMDPDPAYPGVVTQGRSVVVYGDTDSVMVRFDVDTAALEADPALSKQERMERLVAMYLAVGDRAARMCTLAFPQPIKLALEKFFMNYMLFKKKKYAGWKWEVPLLAKAEFMEKGLESVRRDWPPLTSQTCHDLVRSIVVDDDPAAALAVVERQMTRLASGAVPPEELLLSRQLKGEYKKGHKIPHAWVAEQMALRAPGSAPVGGDRLAMLAVVRSGAPDHKCFEEAAYAVENNLPIDYHFYASKQMAPPIQRLLQFHLPDCTRLFDRALQKTFQDTRKIKSIESFFRPSAPAPASAARERPLVSYPTMAEYRREAGLPPEGQGGYRKRHNHDVRDFMTGGKRAKH